MGPRSDNRGYEGSLFAANFPTNALQWVHGPITVVMVTSDSYSWSLEMTSIGSRSADRAYQSAPYRQREPQQASMCPPSDNRGYEDSLSVPNFPTNAFQWVHGPLT